MQCYCTLNKLQCSVNINFICTGKTKRSIWVSYCDICFIVVVWNKLTISPRYASNPYMRNWMVWHIFKRTRQGWSYCIYLCVCKDLWISCEVLILAEHPCTYRGRLAIDSSRIFSMDAWSNMPLFFCLSSSSRRAGVFSGWWQNARIIKSHVKKTFSYIFFFLGVLWFQDLNSSLLIHFKLILVSGVRKESSFISLQCGYPFSQHNHWKDYPFPLCILESCIKSIDHICTGLFLGSLFYVAFKNSSTILF